ncbi:alpha/beta fold hydrolase [Bordetella holmesii]|uniref:Alpha/beta hydrolase family protein n=1 Tax=Bordetella holmesii CDC-H585-BH TaxID=1331206 RepID=A0A158M942_9BORD|nr:alpha/beta hydrolase [Bordetella holmesii]AMD44146.1 alpha/beta hydrolase [Bordetella holmesii H558]AOB36256.1 alpha/beta hydrolase [Bordetella holmesii]AUL20228.1 alpha/beta hydrolase [Bordetella holmesii]AUL23553.1 alpha/beta hydrolase [Bordetella holmesii]AUL26879.1 alpha/beta hydrolase [Bordetella holmesii]
MSRQENPLPQALTDDGVRLSYASLGEGPAVLFVHEFAGDMRSWEPQLRAFARRHRCIVFNARGYPPSDVPEAADAYSQARAVRDMAAVLDDAGVEQAHIVGLSMGGFATLHFGLAFPERARSLTIAGAGYGAMGADRQAFQAASQAAAAQFETLGSAVYGPMYARGAARIPFLDKDARGWQEFADALAEHDARGAALTLRGVQARRPALDTMGESLADLRVPALIIAGDEDDHSLQASLFLKRILPASGLLVLAKTGHTINLEEPAAFNRAVLDFIAQVEASRWLPRDPRSIGQVMPPASA